MDRVSILRSLSRGAEEQIRRRDIAGRMPLCDAIAEVLLRGFASAGKIVKGDGASTSNILVETGRAFAAGGDAVVAVVVAAASPV